MGWDRRNGIRRLAIACLPALLAGVIVPAAALADIVIVESRAGGQHNDGSDTDWYSDSSMSNSSAKSAAPGTTQGIGSRFGFTPTAQFTVSPILGVAGGTYDVDVTMTSADGNTSPDLIVSIAATNVCTDAGCDVLPAETDLFKRGSAAKSPGWGTIGRLTLAPGQTTPSITFAYKSGTAAATGGRFYADAVRFRLVGDPCQGTADVGVNGPLAAGQTTVEVRDVIAGVSAVTVYADGVEIGKKTSEFAGEGVETVTVSPLVKGKSITATQTLNGQEGCKPGPLTGPIVGSGANTKIRVAFGIREKKSLTGPIGANGGTDGTDLFHIPATGTINDAFGAAVKGGIVVEPSLCWQTVSTQRGPDPAVPLNPVYRWTGQDTNTQLEGDYGVLESISFSVENPADTGPYVIYIDNVMNGSTVLQDFEGLTVDTMAMFRQPSYSGTTSQFLLLDGPAADLNTSLVKDTYADTGTKSLRVAWQFKNESPLGWVRLTTDGGAVKPNPVIDLRLPISVRLLVLPVGQTPGTGPVITDAPDSVTTGIGGSAEFTVAATGTGTLHYTWLVNGVPAGNDEPKLTLSNTQLADNGTRVSVSICDANGSTHSADAILTVTKCGVPFADADHDGDVDQEDFGLFQVCFSGDAGGILGEFCGCFDRGGAAPDNDVDMDDFAAFQKCATGPAIPWVQAQTPDCVP